MARQMLEVADTALGPGLQTAGTRNHRPDGPKASHALTMNMDQSMGADQQAEHMTAPDRTASTSNQLLPKGSRRHMGVFIAAAILVGCQTDERSRLRMTESWKPLWRGARSGTEGASYGED